MKYFSFFISELADGVKALYEVLKETELNKKKRKKTHFFWVQDWEKRWGPTQKEAWWDLKMELSNPELLTAPDVAKRKIVMTHASDYVMRLVLIQIDEDGLCRPISFTSRLSRGLCAKRSDYSSRQTQQGRI